MDSKTLRREDDRLLIELRRLYDAGGYEQGDIWIAQHDLAVALGYANDFDRQFIASVGRCADRGEVQIATRDYHPHRKRIWRTEEGLKRAKYSSSNFFGKTSIKLKEYRALIIIGVIVAIISLILTTVLQPLWRRFLGW